MPPEPPQVRVGVGAFVLKTATEDPSNPRFLVGKRINSHGSGTYSLPGGHLEFGETPETCAARELLEETGLAVHKVRFLTATNSYMPDEGKHYITMFMVCERISADDEARNLEPDKCEGWEWTSWEELMAWGRPQLEGHAVKLGERRLFMPLLGLFEQRPGLIPSSQ